MEVVLLVGLVSAIAAGVACVVEHWRAEKHGWDFLRRYGAGGLTYLLAIVPVFIAAVMMKLTPLPIAGLLYAMIVLVLSGMGIGTAASHEPPVAMPEEDPLEKKINDALGGR